ncbi:hypothetical protein WICMUC_002772 [Wickerhamomyces mucosus]|uniref:FUN14 domain-containing protein n=1 Tax=Wickerhamomyces mucosus TaxID=1378264 RepID=A0A9P8PN64_9ASCO|nr:hypothetical protein WICMUC_002772 [Wickerhamomyces mucosus]
MFIINQSSSLITKFMTTRSFNSNNLQLFKPLTNFNRYLSKQTGNLKQISFNKNYNNGYKSSYQKNKKITKLGLFIGATTAVYIHTNNSYNKILNETANLGTINLNGIHSNNGKLGNLLPSTSSNLEEVEPNNVHSKTSRFGLQYKQLCYGSLTGLFFGVVIGKLSTVLGFISLSALLLVQFLQSRQIINVPWNSIVKIGSDKIDVKKLILEDPNFKVSFALTFLIAAFNI